MIRPTIVLFFLFIFSLKNHAQVQISGIEIPLKLAHRQVQPMDLHGIGVRKFLWMDMYVGAVFLNQHQLSPTQIIQANAPMALRLHILSSLVSRKRIIKSIYDGFDKISDGNLPKYQQRIDRMISYFNQDVHPNDIIDLVYKTSGEIMIFRNNKHLGSIEGLDFKQALFSIWLSEKAVDKGLRDGLLKGV